LEKKFIQITLVLFDPERGVVVKQAGDGKGGIFLPSRSQSFLTALPTEEIVDRTWNQVFGAGASRPGDGINLKAVVHRIKGGQLTVLEGVFLAKTRNRPSSQYFWLKDINELRPENRVKDHLVDLMMGRELFIELADEPVVKTVRDLTHNDVKTFYQGPDEVLG
jgi:hypothetical protein